MNLTQLLGFLLLHVGDVLAFFGNLFPSTKLVVENVWGWISSARQQAISTSNIHTDTTVNTTASTIYSFVRVLDGVMHGKVDTIHIDLTNLFHGGFTLLQTAIDDTASRVSSAASIALNTASMALQGAIDVTGQMLTAMGVDLGVRVDYVQYELRMVVHSIGLSVAEKRRLLNMFINDPIGFVASIFFEIAIPILIYEVARGLANASLDIGSAPDFSSLQFNAPSTAGYSGDTLGHIAAPVNSTRLSGLSFDPVSHRGVDLEAYIGRPVKAAHDGFISSLIIEHREYGLCIRIKGDTYDSFYGHLDSVVVSLGQEVKKGDIIAYAGESGNVTGSHLHFELYVNALPVDPFLFMG